MKDVKDYVELINLKGSDEFICLKLFEDTSLRPTSYIRLTILEQCLMLGAESVKLDMYVWEDYENSEGKQTRRFVESELPGISLCDLIKEETAMREYCKKFYPDRVI